MTINAVVHVNDIFAVELKGRCDRFRDELNHLVPVKTSGNYDDLEVTELSNDRGEMGIICPLFRGGDGGGGGGGYEKSPSRGYILTNLCWNEFSLGQACPSANGVFYPTPRRSPFDHVPHAIGDIFLSSPPPPPFRWIALPPLAGPGGVLLPYPKNVCR